MKINSKTINKIGKRLLSVCFSLSLLTISYGQVQSPKIDWEPAYVDDRPYLIGHFDDHFIYKQDVQDKWNISFTDRENNELGSSTLESSCDECFINMHYVVSTTSGNFFISGEFDENQEKLTLYNFKQKDLNIDNKKIFHDQKLELCGRTKGQNSPSTQRKSFEDDYPIGEWGVSPNKSAVGFYNILADDLIHKEKKILVASFDADLNKNWEKTIVLGDKKEKNHFVDIFVDNNGKVFVLLMHKSSDSSIPANSFGYSYKILVVSESDTENIVVNLNDERIIYNASFVKGLNNGKTTVGGYYGKARGHITGNFIFEAGLAKTKSKITCNLFSEIPLDAHPNKYKKVKNNSFRNHEFRMIDVVGFENGNVLFAGEFNWVDIGNGQGQSAQFWGDIVTTMIDVKGNFKETHFVRKNYQTNANFYNSILRRDENHAFITFVDFKKKSERKERDISKGGGYFDLLVLDSSGEIKFNNTINVDRENKIRVSSSFLLLTDDLLIFKGNSIGKHYNGLLSRSLLKL